MNDKVQYFLAIEKRPGDYTTIDPELFDHSYRNIGNDVASIDEFTKRYLYSEIKDLISKNNIVSEDYLDGNLIITSDKSHKLNILTKDMYDFVYGFFSNPEEIDGELRSKIFGAYKKVIDKMYKNDDFKDTLLTRFKDTLSSSNKILLFKIIQEIPYEKSRSIYIYLAKELLSRTKENLEKKNVRVNYKIAS